MIFKKKKRNKESGIALFMVMSALSILALVIGELTYSSQLSLRMAYNGIDQVKAQLNARTALKIALLRLSAYQKLKAFLGDKNNQAIAGRVDKRALQMIWQMPFVFPIELPAGTPAVQADPIKEFQKKISLSGSFSMSIQSESSKLNLNNLFIKKAIFQNNSSQNNSSNQGTAQPVDFRSVLEPTLESLINTKKESDREFAEEVRNITGKDLVDALEFYFFPNKPSPNLPDFNDFKPKLAPLYSMSELYLIPSFSDTLVNLFKENFTVFSTPGINVNQINAKLLRALIPHLTEDDAAQIIRDRDDQQVGKLFQTDKDFWDAIAKTSAQKSITEIQTQFQKANLKILTDEESFKVEIRAMSGPAIRKGTAYILLDSSAQAKNSQNSASGPVTPPNVTTQDGNSLAKDQSGVKLIYWKLY
jgi:type II secretory pathway component PulK